MKTALIVIGSVVAGVVVLLVVVGLIVGNPEPEKKAGPTKSQLAKKACKRETKGAENVIAAYGRAPLGKEYAATLKAPGRSPYSGRWAARCKATVNYVNPTASSNPEDITGGKVVTSVWVVEKRPGKWERVGRLRSKTIPD